MKAIIDEAVKRLGTSTIIKHADENWEQLEFINPPVKWPCALVGIYNGTFTELGRDRTATPQNRQMGTYQIEVTFADRKLANSSSKAPQTQRDNTLSIHDVIEEGHKLLHGWSPGGNIQAFIRERVQKVQRDDGMQQYKVIYTVGVSNV